MSFSFKGGKAKRAGWWWGEALASEGPHGKNKSPNCKSQRKDRVGYAHLSEGSKREGGKDCGGGKVAASPGTLTSKEKFAFQDCLLTPRDFAGAVVDSHPHGGKLGLPSRYF